MGMPRPECHDSGAESRTQAGTHYRNRSEQHSSDQCSTQRGPEESSDRLIGRQNGFPFSRRFHGGILRNDPEMRYRGGLTCRRTVRLG